MHSSLGFARTFIFMCVTIAMSNAQLHREQPLQAVPVLDGRCNSPNPLRIKYLILKSFKTMSRGLFSIRQKDGTRWCFILCIYIYVYIYICIYAYYCTWCLFCGLHSCKTITGTTVPKVQTIYYFWVCSRTSIATPLECREVNSD